MSLIVDVMRRYVREITEDPFHPEALGKAYALRVFIAERPDLVEPDEWQAMNDLVALVAEARQVAT